MPRQCLRQEPTVTSANCSKQPLILDITNQDTTNTAITSGQRHVSQSINRVSQCQEPSQSETDKGDTMNDCLFLRRRSRGCGREWEQVIKIVTGSGGDSNTAARVRRRDG